MRRLRSAPTVRQVYLIGAFAGGDAGSARASELSMLIARVGPSLSHIKKHFALCARWNCLRRLNAFWLRGRGTTLK